jgi:hypothetical protein
MRQEDLRRLMNRQPCPRLRLHLTNGTTFEITDPDVVVVGRSTVELLLPPDAVGEREAVISLLHIIWVEVFPPLTERWGGRPSTGRLRARRDRLLSVLA